ncbi:MAG: phosphotransferase [Chloroflexota bacterium]
MQLDLPVPSSGSQVTGDWLQAALTHNAPITSLSYERIGEGYGLASEIFRYRWDGNGAPQSVVVKLWDTEQWGIREFQFYQTFGEQTGIRTPACLYSAVDTRNQRAVFVLEDLGSVVQGDCLHQIDREQAETVAQGLAQFHARWLANAELFQADWLPSIAVWQRDAEWFTSRRARFLERFGKQVDGSARVLLDAIELAPPIVNARLANAPHTLLHGDLHLDNMVFEQDTTPVLLDWACCAQGPLVIDLVELLFGMIHIKDSNHILQIYLDTFDQCGKPLERSIVHHQLGGAILRKFVASTCGMARWQPALPREEATIHTTIQRATQAVEYWYEQDPGLFAFLP